LPTIPVNTATIHLIAVDIDLYNVIKEVRRYVELCLEL